MQLARPEATTSVSKTIRLFLQFFGGMARAEQNMHSECPSKTREGLGQEEDKVFVFTVSRIYTIQMTERKSSPKKLCSQGEVEEVKEEDDV